MKYGYVTLINFITTVFHMQNEQIIEIPTKETQLPQRNYITFSEPRQASIFFNSNFDSGNMQKVVKISYDHYGLWTANDAMGTENEGYPKSWFYFEVGGFCNRRVTFSVHRVHFLYSMSKRHHMYRPVYRMKQQNGQISEWDRLPYPIQSLGLNNEEELVLKFDFMFNKLIKSVEFAFIYPYAYEQCERDLDKLSATYKLDKEIFLERYQLTKSYEKRSVSMLVISSHQGKEGFENVGKGLPFSEQKITKFRNNKPIIFISARVHPIQTPSSYCMNGIIQFLLDKKDMRAYLLRKYFVFVLVPMLNPDGVARGHCRMDSLNQNLNRYYTNPDPQKQPSCFAVKKLCEHLSKDKRLFMYLDLHAHPAYKGNFTFGNAIYEFIEQVESQLFPKVLSQNCMSFQFQQCIFSRKHMKAKDRNEDISKQGCGRVVFYKQFGLVHSYTLECGYHLNTFDNILENQSNTQAKFVVKYKLNDKGQKIYEQTQKVYDDEKLIKFKQQNEEQKNKNYEIFQYTSHYLDDKENEYYKRQLPLYNQSTFYNLGRNILISILDIWNKNPYTRINDLAGFRKQIAEKQSKLDRFRKQQSGIKAKQKKIVQLIEEQFYGQWHKRNIFNHALSQTNQNCKEKKRNHTLQFQKIGGLRSQKSQKTEKGKEEVKVLSNSETIVDSEVVITQSNQSNPSHAIKLTRSQKNSSITGSQNIIQSRGYYSRNFKLSRGIITTQNRQKQGRLVVGTSINKQLVGTQIKITLEDQLIRINKHDGITLSSKAIKNNSSLNGANLRVRNAINSNIQTNIKK